MTLIAGNWEWLWKMEAFISEVLSEDGVCNSVSRKQLFPDVNTSEENKNFGKVVDVIYKLGRGKDYSIFAF